VHFIFEDHDATFLGAVHNKRIARVKLDRLAVSGEASNQIGAVSAVLYFRGRGCANTAWAIRDGKLFEAVYSPELVGGNVVFTDYELIAGKPTGEQWPQFRVVTK
jgi:hypothetical protein